jgi:hypothetical protein
MVSYPRVLVAHAAISRSRARSEVSTVQGAFAGSSRHAASVSNNMAHGVLQKSHRRNYCLPICSSVVCSMHSVTCRVWSAKFPIRVRLPCVLVQLRSCKCSLNTSGLDEIRSRSGGRGIAETLKNT